MAKLEYKDPLDKPGRDYNDPRVFRNLEAAGDYTIKFVIWPGNPLSPYIWADGEYNEAREEDDWEEMDILAHYEVLDEMRATSGMTPDEFYEMDRLPEEEQPYALGIRSPNGEYEYYFGNPDIDILANLQGKASKVAVEEHIHEGFGYVNGQLFPNARHHAAIMYELVENGMSWEELEAAEQAWGWIATEYGQPKEGIPDGKPRDLNLVAVFYTDTGRIDQDARDGAIKALEEYYGEYVRDAGGTDQARPDEYGQWAKNKIEKQKEFEERGMKNPYGEPLEVLKLGPKNTAAGDELYPGLYQVPTELPPPVPKMPQDLPHGAPNECFGWVDGKLFLGDKHHMGIMNVMMEDFGYTWDDLENAKQAWGWVWTEWSEPVTYKKLDQPLYMIRFTSDAATVMEEEAMERAKAALEAHYGTPLQDTGDRWTAKGDKYAPDYDKNYGEQANQPEPEMSDFEDEDEYWDAYYEWEETSGGDDYPGDVTQVAKVAKDIREVKFVVVPDAFLVGENTYHAHLLKVQYGDMTFPLDTIAIGRAVVVNDELKNVQFDWVKSETGKAYAYRLLEDWAEKQGYLLIRGLAKKAGYDYAFCYMDGKLYVGQNHLTIFDDIFDNEGPDREPTSLMLDKTLEGKPQIWGWMVGNPQEGYRAEFFSDWMEEFQDTALAEEAFRVINREYPHITSYDFGPPQELRDQMAGDFIAG